MIPKVEPCELRGIFQLLRRSINSSTFKKTFDTKRNQNSISKYLFYVCRERNFFQSKKI